MKYKHRKFGFGVQIAVKDGRLQLDFSFSAYLWRNIEQQFGFFGLSLSKIEQNKY